MLANGNNKLKSNGERYIKNNDIKKDNVEDAMEGASCFANDIVLDFVVISVMAEVNLSNNSHRKGGNNGD